MSTIELDFSEEEREALAEFANLGDRYKPFKFVGRTEILTDITNQLALIRKEGESFSNARVIQGPPGSGKTATLRKLGEFEGVIPVYLSGEELSNPAAVASAFVQSCGLDRELLGESHQRTVSGHVGGRWLGLKGGFGTANTTPLEHLKAGIPVLDLIDSYLRLPESTIFLVLIDEAQGIESDQGSALNSVAIALGHGNTGDMKIMTVFGGLSDTLSTLRSVKVSPRITSGGKHFLGQLEPEDAEDLITSFFNHEPFGLHRLPDHQKDALIRRILEASERYPKHIQSYIKGVASVCALEQQNQTIDTLLEPGHQIRIDYYSQELIDLENLDLYTQTLSKVTIRHGSKFSLNDIETVGREMYELGTEELRNGHKSAIHQGLIEIDWSRPGSERPVHIPIPSLATFMATGFDRDKTLELLKGSDQHIGR